jgi:predicted PurR-regulated permease PerM
MADKEIREKRTIARRVYLDPSTPPTWSVVRVVFIVLLMLAVKDFVGNILSSLTYLFFLIVLSIFFAYLIDPLVKFIRRPFKERNLEKLMPRAFAILIAYLIVFSVLGIAIANLAPRLAEQGAEFAKTLPEYAKLSQERIAEINQRFNQLNVSQEVQQAVTGKISSFIDTATNLLTSFATNLALNIVSYSPWLILVPVLSFLFLKDVNLFRVALLRIFPSGRWRSRAESVLADVNSTLRAYTRAQLISCFIIGFICTVMFYVLGIKYALLLGIAAGILEFIPLIGPITIGITVTTTALFGENPWKALYVAIFLIILRIIHDYYTYPRIVREGIHLHPLAIILSVLAGEQVAGIPGVFLSIPIVAIATVFYKHILEHSGSKGLFAGWLEPKEVSDEAK